MALIDTHAHLLMEKYPGGLKGVLERARQGGVEQVITVATTLDDSQAGIAATREHEGLWCTLGIHPHEAARLPSDFIQQLEFLAPADRVCALGEVGLDYHYDHAPRRRQQEVFIAQLDLAARLDLPVVVHCREAFDDCFAILDEWNNEQARVVFHCFSGPTELARQVLDRGFHLSFTGIVTFDKARDVQASACYAPLGRIMLETDCPFLSPAPKRGQWPNEPALLVHIAEKLGQLRGRKTEEIAETTTATARTFFGLDKA